MEPPSTSGLRFRQPALTQRIDTQRYTYSTKNGTVLQNKKYGDKAVFRQERSMYDVVTPNYRKRSAAGEVINSPMVSTEELLDFPLAPYEWVGNKLTDRRIDGLAHPPMLTKRLTSKESMLTNTADAAITAAYANVSANEGNTLLWLGEFKESLSMFKDIGTGARVLYEKTKKQRVKWAKGKLTVEEAQGLTLQLLYGILPLEQQITDFLDGLFKTKSPGRQTARSFRVISKQASYMQDVRHSGSIYDMTARAIAAEDITTTFRAGVYYEFDITDAPWLSVILEPKAVISTAYALARLSFVFDWFINVGSTLKAWSPTSGINELSAWITVETTHTQVVKYIEPNDHPYDVGVFTGGGYTHVTKTKWRRPVSRSDLLLLPRVNINLDLDKVFAMVLLFAKIRKTI